MLEEDLVIPQPTYSQLIPQEGALTSITHELPSFEAANQSLWKMMDEQYHNLEDLQALHISIRFVSPEFRDKEKAWVEAIAWHL